jgi:hypothetical protein
MFIHGDWNVICDSCGFKFKASQVFARWDNLMVCRDCWETKHPQESVKSIPDRQVPPFVRPGGSDLFITVPTVYSRTVDCADEVEVDTGTTAEICSPYTVCGSVSLEGTAILKISDC